MQIFHLTRYSCKEITLTIMSQLENLRPPTFVGCFFFFKTKIQTEYISKKGANLITFFI